MDAVERNGYALIPHPAYSPDLPPSNFFLFPNLKKDIRGCHFRSDEEVVTAVEEWVIGKDPDFFSSGLMALEHVGLSASHYRAITSKKKRRISTGNKLGSYLLIHPRVFNNIKLLTRLRALPTFGCAKRDVRLFIRSYITKSYVLAETCNSKA